MYKNVKKGRLLKVYEILKATDESNTLTTNQIIDKLKDDNINCVRKTLYEDIKTLIDVGYDIVVNKTQRNNYYMIDNYLDLSEARLLVDTINQANFISKRMTDDLINKIGSLTSNTFNKHILDNKAIFGFNKTNSSKWFYYLHDICIAISNKKKISFQYTYYNEDSKRELRKNGYTYKVNPLTMILSNNKYYVITSNEKYDNLSLYRLDRMINLEVLEESYIENDKLLNENYNQMFEMHFGKRVLCKFNLYDYMFDIVIDHFGEDIKFNKIDDKLYSFETEVQISPAFISWCVRFGNELYVVSPSEVLDKIKEVVIKLNKVYIGE
ncbi:MAG: WYL domain-containing protein [bacterium]